jgi:hypothetical protein
MDYTQSEVDRILEASEKARKGPWLMEVYDEDILIVDSDGELVETVYTGEANARLLAGAPILAEEVKRLREENNELRSALMFDNTGP